MQFLFALLALALSVCHAARQPQTHYVRALRVTATDGDYCNDMACVKDHFVAAQDSNGLVRYDTLTEAHFGRFLKVLVNRMMFFMGMIHGSDYPIYANKFEVSPNKMQLKATGYLLNPYDEIRYASGRTSKRGFFSKIKIVHYFTLEEQNFVSCAVETSIQREFFENMDTAVSIGDVAQDIMDDVKYRTPPKFTARSFEKSVATIKVAGVTRTPLEDAPGLQKFAAENVDFKHEPKWGGYALKSSVLRLSLRADLPWPNGEPVFQSQLNGGIFDAQNISDTLPAGISLPSPRIAELFDCSSLNFLPTRQICTSAVAKSEPQVELEVFRGTVRPYLHFELDTGYGNNPFSHWFHAVDKGQTIKVGVKNVPIFTGLILTKAHFIVKWSALDAVNLLFGFEGDVKFNVFGQPINFESDIMIPSSSGLKVSIQQTKVVELPWGIPIALGNLQTKFKVTYGVVPTLGGIGGEFFFGRHPETAADEDTRIKVMGYVTLDFSSFYENVIYGKVSQLTIQSLVNMFVGHSRWEMPAFLGKTGLSGIKQRYGRLEKVYEWEKQNLDDAVRPSLIPQNEDQVIFCFTAVAFEEKIISEISSAAIIQPGLTVIGQLQVLGVGAKMYARVDYMRLGLELDIALLPVNLGNGLVKLTAADIKSHDFSPEWMANEGPNLYLAFQLLPQHRKNWPVPEFRMSASLEIFGVRVAIDTLVSRYGFHYKTELNVWDWFVAKTIIEVYSHNGGIKNGVRVYGELTFDSIQQLAKGFFNKVLKKIAGLFFYVPESEPHRALGIGKKVKSKFKKSLKKIGKALRKITNVTLFSVKFDLNNLNPDKSIPVFTEFEITIFGKHIIKYKRRRDVINFDHSLDEIQENQMAEEVRVDLEKCFEHCEADDEACLDRIIECKNAQFTTAAGGPAPVFDDSPAPGHFRDRDA